MTTCTCCKKELTGGLDTYGDPGMPMCFDCHWDLTIEGELICKEYEKARSIEEHELWMEHQREQIEDLP